MIGAMAENILVFTGYANCLGLRIFYVTGVDYGNVRFIIHIDELYTDIRQDYIKGIDRERYIRPLPLQ
jgi:hypothetical protein